MPQFALLLWYKSQATLADKATDSIEIAHIMSKTWFTTHIINVHFLPSFFPFPCRLLEYPLANTKAGYMCFNQSICLKKA